MSGAQALDAPGAKPPETAKAWYGGLDLLRCAAILAIVAYHANVLTPREVAGARAVGVLGHFGWAGVDLFFVLSGYLIASQQFQTLARDPRSPLGRFYARRFLRTLPNYFVVLAITYGVGTRFLGESWSAPWRYFLFLQNYSFPAMSFVISWSLCVEEHFYLLFPLVALWLMRRESLRPGALFAAALLVAEPLLRAHAWHAVRPGLDVHAYYEFIYYPTHLRLDGLTWGVSLAALHRLRPALWTRLTKRPDALLAAGALGTLAAMALTFHERSFLGCTLGLSLFPLAFALVLASALCPGSLLARVKLPGAARLAQLSYAIYLTHLGALGAGERLAVGLLHQPTELLLAPLQLALILLFALALYLLVEQPIMARRDAWLGIPHASGQPAPLANTAR